MRMRGFARRLLAGVGVAAVLVLAPAPAQAQVAEAQRLLNQLSLDAGPEDGAAGPRTMAAWQIFLKHRGLPADTPLDKAGLVELQGQTDIDFPEAEGLRFVQAGFKFPSVDTYERDPSDPTAFSMTLRGNDYDPADYRDSTDVIERTVNFNFRKQRAEIASQHLRSDRPYTVDFEVKLSNLNTGSFFQVHRGNKSGFLLGTINTGFLVNAGEIVQNIVIHEPELFNTWHAFRIVFFPASDGNSWFRIYVDGELKLDTSDRNAKLPYFDEAATVTFGLYRGITNVETRAHFRGLKLHQGDLGAPGAG